MDPVTFSPVTYQPSNWVSDNDGPVFFTFSATVNCDVYGGAFQSATWTLRLKDDQGSVLDTYQDASGNTVFPFPSGSNSVSIKDLAWKKPNLMPAGAGRPYVLVSYTCSLTEHFFEGGQCSGITVSRKFPIRSSATTIGPLIGCKTCYLSCGKQR